MDPHATITTVLVVPVRTPQTSGKIADVELQFAGGVLDGLKLQGFSIWQRRGGGGQNVTFPARQYLAGGQKRTYALLRATVHPEAQERLRDLILEVYARTDLKPFHAPED